MSRRTWIGFKLIMASAGFLTLSIVTALCVRSWTEKLSDRSPASVPVPIFEGRGPLSASELGMLGSTVLTRGRKVVFHDERFRDEYAYNQGFDVELNLFPDTSLTVRFQAPSAFQVNKDIFVGQVVGDAASSVNFKILSHVLDGTIQTKNREYRIIDGGNGLQYITEAPLKP